MVVFFFFFFNDTATTEIYTLSLHDALPISGFCSAGATATGTAGGAAPGFAESAFLEQPASGRASAQASATTPGFHARRRAVLTMFRSLPRWGAASECPARAPSPACSAAPGAARGRGT